MVIFTPNRTEVKLKLSRIFELEQISSDNRLKVIGFVKRIKP